MKALWLAAAVGVSLMALTGGASADPWKNESGHGRFGGKHWKHEGRGHGWGKYGFRGNGYYRNGRGYRDTRYDRPRFRDYDRYGY